MGTTLRCFIAMAFNYADTDKLYETVIKPLLRAHSIVPVRVDRIQHQERIDQFIIDEISRADLAIVDLSYARPSVYYEAGFAERKIPVIYACRKDHFSGQREFKVHFDLLTKNIVGWSGANDRTFYRRLKARLIFVTKPLLRDNALLELRRRQVEEFGAKPLSKRLESIGDVLERAVRASSARMMKEGLLDGLVPDRLSDTSYNSSQQRLLDLVRSREALPLRLSGQCRGLTVRKGDLRVTVGVVVSSITVKELRDLRRFWYQPPLCDLTPRRVHIKRLLEHYVICSTGNLDVGSAMNILHEFSRRGNDLMWTTTQSIPQQRQPVFRESYQLDSHTFMLVNPSSKPFTLYRRYHLGDEALSLEGAEDIPVGTVQRTVLISFIGKLKSLQEATEQIASKVNADIFRHVRI